MLQTLQSTIESYNIPLFTAFVLGIICSLSPCTFSTNVMALGFIAKDIDDKNRVFLNGILYTLGRLCSYTILGLICISILKQGAGTYAIQRFISQYGGHILAPVLVFFGLYLLFGDKLTAFRFGFRATERSKKLRGGVGAFILGLLFALAFCPVSGLFYFGVLLPMSTLDIGGYFYPAVFAISSSILVVAIAWIIAYSMSGLGKFHKQMHRIQKYLNIIVGIAFIVFGIYNFMLYYF